MYRNTRIFTTLAAVTFLGFALVAVAETVPVPEITETAVEQVAVDQTTVAENCDNNRELSFDMEPPRTSVARQINLFGGSEEATFCDDSLTGGTSGSCETDGIAGGEIVCANGNTPRSINCSLPGGTGCPNGTKCKCSWSCNRAQVLPID